MITLQLCRTSTTRDISVEQPLYVLHVDNPHSRDHVPERVDRDGTVLDLDALEVSQLKSTEKRGDFRKRNLSAATLTVKLFYRLIEMMNSYL